MSVELIARESPVVIEIECRPELICCNFGKPGLCYRSDKTYHLDAWIEREKERESEGNRQ